MKYIYTAMIVLSVPFGDRLLANVKQGFFERIQTDIAEPLDLRDPFKSQIQAVERKAKAPTTLLQDNSYSNLPILGDVTLDQIVITGILLGRERMATARVRTMGEPGSTKVTGPSYPIKEGKILGKNRAEVRAILPGGVVLVERITNVYEQDEYIETIIPITSN